MFGVVFDGHPDLRRILMPEDYEGFPQRRDFPIGGEPVLFTYNETETPGWCRVSTHEARPTTASARRRRSTSRLSSQPVAVEGADELLTLNIGPHHPATHGVLRLLVTLEGEVVRDIKPIIGYVHTGIEKTGEDKAYWKVIPVDRADGLPLLLLQRDGLLRRGRDAARRSRCPQRAQYLRVIHLELNRIMSHLVWLGTSALDLGAISMFWYCFREREKILDLFEMSSGQRMHTRYFQVGGVIEDIPRGFEPRGPQVPRGHAQPRRPVRGDPRQERDRPPAPARRRALVEEQTLLDLGVTGPLLRATGNPWDLRKATPYSLLRRLRLQDPGRHGRRQLRPLPRPPGRDGTSPARSSSRRSTACPKGPYITEDRKVALPPRHELATSMEALIHHFKLVTEGFRVPPGEVYYPIECAARRARLLRALRRLVQAGARAHARPELREPAGAARRWRRDTYIADLIATLAMLDPILGGIDR